jgi:uncharacterized membrane protein YdbT with pleckstrin-like domain
MNEPAYNTNPVRSSAAILVFKLILVVLIVDIAYGIVDYALNLYLSIPLEWHHHLSVGLVALLAVKTMLEVGLILYVALDWVHRTFQLHGQNLIIMHGLWRASEEAYELRALRLVSITESTWSRLLGFGNIVLSSSEPGREGTISLVNISNPHQFESMLSRPVGAER